MVWGEHGNWGLDISNYDQVEHFLPEWVEVIQRDFNHPTLIGWCPFNETWDNSEDRQKYRGEPYFVSEYGGIKWTIDEAEEGWGYGDAPKTEDEFIERYEALTNALLDTENILFAIPNSMMLNKKLMS